MAEIKQLLLENLELKKENRCLRQKIHELMSLNEDLLKADNSLKF